MCICVSARVYVRVSACVQMCLRVSEYLVFTSVIYERMEVFFTGVFEFVYNSLL